MADPDPVSLLRDDQCGRWRRGERPTGERYLEHPPERRDDPDGRLDLICNGAVLREEAGEAPRLEECLGRFPAFRDELRLQFQVHRALEAGVAAGDEVDADADVDPGTSGTASDRTARPAPAPAEALS